MVAHNGGDYLPSTLAALSQQTRPVDAYIGVDTGSRDDSLVLLSQAFGEASVTSFQQGRSGMGDAVKAGLAAISPRNADPRNPDVQGAGTEWIWLLHDDAAPAPEALAELLYAVERAPSVTVAGCKQLDWDARRRLIDVGLSTSRWAERLTLIEADELDQGQYDGRSDTFAVNSAGMLVRRDVWEELGGFDHALPGTGDDVDFCWRNRLAGHRVVVVPTARMFHVSHRPHALGSAGAARKAQVYLRLKHSVAWKLPLHAAGALLGSLFKLVLSIAVKDPGHGFSQLMATFVALGRPGAVIRGRRDAARTRRIRRSVIKGLQTPRREVWAHRRSLIEALGSDDSDPDPARTDPLAEQPSGDSTDDFAALSTSERGWVGNGALLAVILTAAASLIGLSGFFRAEAVTGGALIPVSSKVADIWHHATSWWIGLGAGLPGHGDPFDFLLWVLGLVGGGDANGALAWLLLLAMPLAGLFAWFAAGGLTTRRRFRLVAALVWGGAPALQVALNQGRLGALVAHVMVPLLVLALLRATGTARGQGRFAVSEPGDPRFLDKPLAKPGVNGTPSWTAAAAAGLALAVVAAGAPSLLLPSAVVVVLAGVLLGRRGRTVWWALLPSAALFVPFGISVLERPRALLADPGVPLGFEGAPLWQQILGQPLYFDAYGGVAGLPVFDGSAVPWALLLALVIGFPVLALATAALFVPGKRTRVARALWVAALIILAGGWLAGHVATAAGADALVTPFTGPAVSASGFLLLGAALIGADGLLCFAEKTAAAPAARRMALQSLSVLAIVLLLAGPVAGMTAWAAGNLLQSASGAAAAAEAALPLGTPRQIAPTAARTLPATAIDRGQGPEQTRTLVIDTVEDGSFDASIVRGAGTTLDGLSTIAAARNIMGDPGEETVRDDDAATAALRSVVATVVAGQGVDPRPELERLGAGFVVLRASDTAAQLTASRMDAVPGLVAVGQTNVGWLWRISPLNQPVIDAADVAHRVRIVDGTGAAIGLLPSHLETVDAAVPEGPEGRLVVLAERADPGWSAWIDGRRLTSTTSGWSQAFTLPAQGGQLSVRYENPWALWTAIGQATIIGLTILLAIPMPARRPNTGLSRDEGSLRKEHQHA
ncbi:glycosyltransferase family 2 protein [Arthrobacter oryzae]|uniref:glycosyltransferase family 2 protein n=1 Tax=Arthrobacter oryzae TaxID=409290 RepID=UPI00273AFCBB|nr:glycosyltransferase family 2 protein [Arthrobacter oryzae]WLQ05210.1 glycosyltransferase family 2 protein [Arthrobacter oryzae]